MFGLCCGKCFRHCSLDLALDGRKHHGGIILLLKETGEILKAEKALRDIKQ
jgi:hypothetical protein